MLRTLDRIKAADEAWLSDPEIFMVNRLDAHSDHMYYEDKDAMYGDEMPLRQSLNGTWKINYAVNIEASDREFYKEDRDATLYDDIKVPGHMELQGFGRCQYINTMYPWEGSEDLRPPHIPREDAPVGCYVRYFDINPELAGKRTFISFQGVENAFYLWINGQFVGYAEDSFTPSEFDITDYIRDTNNKLAVRVHKRSSASWLEDQDFWRFSGIFRDVYLYAIPKTHVQNVFAHAGLDGQYTDGIFKAELTITGSLNGHIDYEITDEEGKHVAGESGIPVKAAAEISCVIKDVRKWSAEIPNLYNLKVLIYDEEGRLVENIPQHIGFRTMEMKDGLMLINGKRIVFKGVNRHEFSAVNGRCVTREEMEKDACIIKSLNINAVRTSHYPNNSYWYYLCDKYGIYLIDETNLETHGCVYIDTGSEPPYRVPDNKKEWLGAVLFRAQAMLERDKNHPSVVIWSCGNESHAGEDIRKMAEFFRVRDPERLVHYEGCFHNREYSDISDMESRMYAKPYEIAEYLDQTPKKPYISCEYTHAMGNSCGGMFKYTELEDRYPQYQGGFIWDYADQALLKDGEFMVGGDYGDRPNDGFFCGNGIVFADRKLSPKAQEVKKLYAGIRLYPTDEGVVIENNNLFEDTTPYIFEVRVLKDGKAIWAVTFGCDVKPQSVYMEPVRYPDMTEPGEYVKEVRAVLMAFRKWAPVGDVVAWGQSEPVTVTGDVADTDAPAMFDDVIMGNSCIGVKTAGVHAIFSRYEGGLISYRRKGLELIDKVPQLTFWRPVTDNDKGNGFDVASSVWAGVTQYPGRATWKVEYELIDGRILDGTVCCDEFIVPESDELYGTGLKGREYAREIMKVILTYTYKLRTYPETECVVRYTMTPDARITVKAEYTGAAGVPDMPQFGMVITCGKEFDNVEFYGRGPEENYHDRDKGARFGIYKFKADDNLTPYLNPQECGLRCDVRYAKITNADKHGIHIEKAEAPFDLKVLAHSGAEIQSAYKINYLPPRRLTYIEVLGATRGVGGDDSWGAPVHDEFTVSGEHGQGVEFVFYGI